MPTLIANRRNRATLAELLIAALCFAMAAFAFALPDRSDAAPIATAVFSGSAHGDVVGIPELSVAATNLVDLALPHAESLVNSETAARSTASANNLHAVVAGLPIQLPTPLQQTAPPDNAAPLSDTLLPVAVPGVVDLPVMLGEVHARWPGDAACLPSGTPLSRSMVSTTNASVLPVPGTQTSVLGLPGTVSTTTTTSLVTAAGANDTRAVQSKVVPSIATVNVLGGSAAGGLTIQISGEPSLTATATGTTGTVTFVEPTIVVLGPQGTIPVPLDGHLVVPLTIAGVLTATITLDLTQAFTNTVAGTTASGSASLLTLDVLVEDVLGVAELAHITAAVQPMDVTATAPADGIQCAAADTTAPAAPVITSPTNGSTTTDTTPPISGTGEPGATVTVREGDRVLCTATVQPNGTWSCTSATLTPGTHTIVATQADPAGNVSPPSNVVTFTVTTGDGVVPPPVITSPTEGSTVTDTTPPITGTGTPGATVTVTDGNGNPVCTATVNAQGNWSCTPTTPLPAGPNTVNATQTVGGQTSAPDTVNFVVGSGDGGPQPPTITSPTPGENVTTNPPPITGTGQPGATVTVTDGNGNVICTATVDANGNWSCVPDGSLACGTHTLIAVQKDAAGRISGPSQPVTFTIVCAGTGSGGGDGGLPTTGPEHALGTLLAALLALIGGVMIMLAAQRIPAVATATTAVTALVRGRHRMTAQSARWRTFIAHPIQEEGRHRRLD